MEMNMPLISPLSRKYYLYAGETKERIHHRAIDIRMCLEYICDEIVIQFVSPETNNKWNKYKLHNKIEATKEFMDSVVVDKVLKAKGIGNKGAHEGEEGAYTSQDIDDSLEAIKQFSLEIFYSYFLKNGFGDNEKRSWVPTVFSTLPPIYRVTILCKYYKYNQSPFVIDKLSKAYLKSGMKKEAIDFLENCFKKKEIVENQFVILKYDLDLLEQSFDRLPIADTLEVSKDNFNRLILSINEDERDVFVCLVSTILNGES
ncbi:hypothetical protein FHS16_005667 [Paenibacillus endophyticus]|uniref:DUF4145 domain-containing protein n=1 Tax=Paenibacillus endophyticus TaxID=1294268 RepID=A0A7W5GCM4_9BACL|nr:DUF4145 domain-containing protein [Paenibacillus endophyticus]MBB3155559.1 hypothetical protein [Paenibacillus endophyticus]